MNVDVFFFPSSRCFVNVWASCFHHQDSILTDVKAIPQYWTPEDSLAWYWIGPSTDDSLDYSSFATILCQTLASIPITSQALASLDQLFHLFLTENSLCPVRMYRKVLPLLTSTSQIIKMLRNILFPALGLALCTNASVSSQDQMASPAGLWEIAPGAESITVWFSNITDTIYGQFATNFDSESLGDGNVRDFDAAIESVEHFAKVFAEGDADAVLVAFSNHSMLGRLSAEEAANKEWLCRELDCPMNQVAEACEGVGAPCSVW
jgi:hypothetical protein